MAAVAEHQHNALLDQMVALGSLPHADIHLTREEWKARAAKSEAALELTLTEVEDRQRELAERWAAYDAIG